MCAQVQRDNEQETTRQGSTCLHSCVVFMVGSALCLLNSDEYISETDPCIQHTRCVKEAPESTIEQGTEVGNHQGTLSEATTSPAKQTGQLQPREQHM